MDKNIDRHLVIRAMMIALWKRQPKATVLVHSDQGSQCSSADYVAFLRANNPKPSMSRRGNCHGNAVAESFFATFKKRVTQRRIYIQQQTMQRRRYLILLRCFTIRLNYIVTLELFLQRSLKKTISPG